MAPTQQSAPAGLQAVSPMGTPTEGGLAAVIAAALIGALVTLYLMTEVAYPAEFSADVEAMQNTSQWVGWVLVLAIQTATWFALLVPVFRVMVASSAPWSVTMFAHIALVLVLLALPFLATDMFDRTHEVQGAFTSRLLGLSAVGSIVGLLAAVGILRTGAEIAHAESPENPRGDEVRAYLEIRRRLVFLGGVLAVIVALAMLATGGQRNTIVAMETARATAAEAAAEVAENDDEKEGHLMTAASATRRATRFGVELVWAYGLYYSFVLIIVYLPAYMSMLARGRTIRDQLAPEVLPTQVGYEESKKVRDALDDVLRLKLSAVESLKVAALVLVPVATSFASTLLGETKVGG